LDLFRYVIGGSAITDKMRSKGQRPGSPSDQMLPEKAEAYRRRLPVELHLALNILINLILIF